ELRDPVGRAWLRGSTAFVRLLAGRLSEARRLASVFLPFGEHVGEEWAVGTLRAVAAYADAELGELAGADSAARRAFEGFEAAGAEEDARAVLAVVAPHDVREAAQVGPKVLLALARQAAGDLDAALPLLAELVQSRHASSLLFSPRQVVSCYAGALLAAGRVD